MQPTQKFKKTLLAGALILGTCNAFTASAELLTVAASAVPDVEAAPVDGFTQVSFGENIIGNKSGSTCTLTGISDVADADMLFDNAGDSSDANNGNVNGTTVGVLGGSACINGAGGEVMIIEIDGADASTVSVTVNDVTGTGWVYTPTSESCVVDFDRALDDTQDVCRSLASNTVTGIGMSNTQVDGVDAAASNELVDGADGYALMTGKTRMILAGSITLNADLGQGTIVGENIIVQVTYE